MTPFSWFLRPEKFHQYMRCLVTIDLNMMTVSHCISKVKLWFIWVLWVTKKSWLRYLPAGVWWNRVGYQDLVFSIKFQDSFVGASPWLHSQLIASKDSEMFHYSLTKGNQHLIVWWKYWQTIVFLSKAEITTLCFIVNNIVVSVFNL